MLYLSWKGFQTEGGTKIIMNMRNVNCLHQLIYLLELWLCHITTRTGLSPETVTFEGQNHGRENRIFWRLHFSELSVKSMIVSRSTVYVSRSQWPRGLRRRSAAAVLLGLRVRIPPRNGCPSLVRDLCSQVEIFAWRWSLVQRSTAECGVSECYREASIKRKSWTTRGICAVEKRKYIIYCCYCHTVVGFEVPSEVSVGREPTTVR